MSETRDQFMFSDFPEHQDGLTSSVGALWPPKEASFRRIKGIWTEGPLNNESLVRFLESFHNECKKMDGRQDSPTRVQLRALVPVELLIENREKIGDIVEAALSLNDMEFGEDLALVYFAQNHPSRAQSEEDLSRLKANLEEVNQVKLKSVKEILERTNGYEVDILEIPEDESAFESLVSEMTGLYERFGWKKDQVAEILRNKDNIFSVAKKDGKIVSAGIAEIVQIPMGSDCLRMAEITEAATLDEYGGNGLYTAVSTKLLLRLAQMSKNKALGGYIHLVFGECNSASIGVLKTAKAQGRFFCGLLKQQVPIHGVPVNTEYNDLIPAYLTGNRLLELYGS